MAVHALFPSGVLASVENERLGSEGYISVSLTRLATEDALTLASRRGSCVRRVAR